MPQPINAWSWAALVALLALSAFFNTAEIAFSSANGLRLKNNAEGGRLSDRLAYFIYERFDRTLTTTLIGNNIAGIVSASLATVMTVSLLGEKYDWVSTPVMTVVVLIFCEITPKMAAARVPDEMCRIVALPFRAVMVLTFPLVWLVSLLLNGIARLWKTRLPAAPAVTEDDLESIIETADDEGVLDDESSELLQNTLDFGDTQVYEILTPRVDMQAVDIDDPLEEILEQVWDSPHSRIPVYQDTTDNIIGILHLNLLFRELVDDPTPDIRALLLPVTFVHKTMPLDVALSVMKRNNSHMVIVNDEYGGTMGLVTMEDVLEELVGEIWDETDEIEEEFEEIAPDLYECEGDMNILDFFDELDIDAHDYDEDNATVGGWAMDMLGGYPEQGSAFDYKNITVTVKEMSGRRIESLSVRVHPDADDGSDGD